jgi:hypothetical protein
MNYYQKMFHLYGYIVTDLIACQQYMIIAIQRVHKHRAIRTCNNSSYIIAADVITRY